MYAVGEALPGLDCRSRIRIHSLGLASPNEDTFRARKDSVLVNRIVFTSYDTDNSISLGDEACLVVSKDELSQEDEGLCKLLSSECALWKKEKD